ncbi:phosphotransferase [Microbacterium sp. CCNWLW134]|uniref:phosphotransferase n=1 Tax=Microbacterium sp. CCNWLW134 TaxID=3122064 RepID=UPI0030104DC8
MIGENGQRLLERVRPLLEAMGRRVDEVTEASPIIGRNLNGEIVFDDGDRVFVKQLGGMAAGERHARSVSFHDCVRLADAGADLRAPALRAAHAPSVSLAYEWVDARSTFAQSIREVEAETDEVRRAGRCVAALHSLEVIDPDAIDRSRPMFPPAGPNAMSRETFYGSTMGQLDMWRFIQRDQPLLDALNLLVDRSRDGRRTPAHGDLRADQIFLTAEEAFMLDWEEFRLGDPARDVGAMLGEVFYHRLRRTIVDASMHADELDDADVVRFGSEAIDTSRPLAQAFWRGYRDRVADDIVDAAFVDRAVSYFGWQLFDRSLASGTYFGRVSALDRALAGIGREAIVGSDRYGAVLGLDDLSTQEVTA